MIYFTLAEISEVLGVNIETVRRWARKKSNPRLEVHNTNRGHIVSEQDLRKFLKAKGYNYDQSLFPALAKDKPDYKTPPTILGSSTVIGLGTAAATSAALAALGGSALIAGSGVAGSVISRLSGAAAGIIAARKPNQDPKESNNTVDALLQAAAREQELADTVQLLLQEVNRLQQRVRELEQEKKG